MLSTLPHRGPDGWGIYLGKGIALGQTRLSVVDLECGHQPMASARYVIVYNGEIYNHIELRRELVQKGVQFRTTCDTEVALKAFEAYGIDAFPKFNGQFAMLVWDRIDGRLIAARDRYGVRPLYILCLDRDYYFASEMKAFDTIEGYGRSFNIRNLFQHALLWNTIDDRTVYENVRSLPGGTCEVYVPGCPPRKIRYYDLGESQSNSPPILMPQSRSLPPFWMMPSDCGCGVMCRSPHI